MAKAVRRRSQAYSIRYNRSPIEGGGARGGAGGGAGPESSHLGFRANSLPVLTVFKATIGARSAGLETVTAAPGGGRKGAGILELQPGSPKFKW